MILAAEGIGATVYPDGDGQPWRPRREGCYWHVQVEEETVLTFCQGLDFTPKRVSTTRGGFEFLDIDLDAAQLLLIILDCVIVP